MKNKKASAVFDIFTWLIFGFVTIILCVTAVVTASFIADAFSSQDVSPIAKEETAGYASGLPQTLDFFIAGVIIIAAIGLFIFTYLFDNNPAFFVFFLILGFIISVVSLPLANVLFDLSQDSFFNFYFASLPATSFFISNWIWVLVSYLVAVIVGFGAKTQTGGIQ